MKSFFTQTFPPSHFFLSKPQRKFCTQTQVWKSFDSNLYHLGSMLVPLVPVTFTSMVFYFQGKGHPLLTSSNPWVRHENSKFHPWQSSLFSPLSIQISFQKKIWPPYNFGTSSTINPWILALFTFNHPATHSRLQSISFKFEISCKKCKESKYNHRYK